MNEDEAIKILKDETDYLCEDKDKAIETILDLYQHKKGRIDELKQELLQEKEKNKELSEELTEQICNKVEVEVLEEYRLKLKNSISKDKIADILEKYKYTKIEDSIKIIEFYKEIQKLLEEE